MFSVFKLFFTVNISKKQKKETNKIPAIIVPELKGSPISFTKKTSSLLKYSKMLGAKSLNTNIKIATTAILAKMNFSIVIGL